MESPCDHHPYWTGTPTRLWRSGGYCLFQTEPCGLARPGKLFTTQVNSLHRQTDLAALPLLPVQPAPFQALRAPGSIARREVLVTNYPQAVVRAKSKRELIRTLARPHMLRSSEHWLATSNGRPGWLAVGSPQSGATTSDPHCGFSSWSLCDLICDALYRAPSWFATSNGGDRLVALGHSR